jgi:hypothetical protein
MSYQSLINIKGQRFGRLKVLKYIGKCKWKCRCDCGRIKLVRGSILRANLVKSCGCLARFYLWALSNGYEPWLSIERKNNDEGYSPKNCTWIPKKDQSKNRRPYSQWKKKVA